MFPAACAALLEAAEGHDAEEHDEQADGAGDDAYFGGLGEGGPAVANVAWFLDFFEDGGFTSVMCVSGLCECQFVGSSC